LSLAIESTRFGRVEIDPETVIEFPDGLIGLGGSRYALLARDQESAFAWLQSLDDPGLALPITNPHRFFAGYEVKLTDEDVERLGIDAETPADVFVTVRAGASLEDFTANQKAPILVWGGRGYQIINQAPGCDLRAPLFAGVEIEPAGRT
jgi:flagellar assembly factor FliW